MTLLLAGEEDLPRTAVPGGQDYRSYRARVGPTEWVRLAGASRRGAGHAARLRRLPRPPSPPNPILHGETWNSDEVALIARDDLGPIRQRDRGYE